MCYLPSLRGYVVIVRWEGRGSWGFNEGNLAGVRPCFDGQCRLGQEDYAVVAADKP